MSSPASHSHASASPDASQAHPAVEDLVPLEALVSHLLASKRSLSSISTVWRANELVTSARSALEESVILSSKTTYLRDGISEQVKILRNVRGGIENVYKEAQMEFEVHTHSSMMTTNQTNRPRPSSRRWIKPTRGWYLQWMYYGPQWSKRRLGLLENHHDH